MNLSALFGPERNFGRKGTDWVEQGGLQRRGACLGAYVKISNSASYLGVTSKGGPSFALWEQQELVLILSFPCSSVLFLSPVFLIPLLQSRHFSLGVSVHLPVISGSFG